ncbi:hypothetical protein DMUE_3705 [Dictyocoela muelleri]|nr:hypothetical protein DMUE_3705 [Dictyocoela muelleri]
MFLLFTLVNVIFSAKDETNLIGVPLPLYFNKISFSYYFVPTLIFIAVQSCIIIATIIPLKYLTPIQRYITISLGSYYLFLHILCHIDITGTIYWGVSLILSVIPMILSQNPKFSILFLSIEGSYVLSYMFIGLFRISSFIIFILSFIVFTVLLMLFGKANRELHYSVTKGFIIAFASFVVVEMATFINLINGMHDGIGTTFLFSVIRTLSFAALTGFIALITYKNDYFVEKISDNKK